MAAARRNFLNQTTALYVRLKREDPLSPSVDVPPASFRDAVTLLRSFLRSHGRPEAVVWINPDDLVSVRSRLHVRVRSPNRRWMDAQVRYELGLDRKMGILLYQLCQAPGLSCCHVYIPRNASDAEQRALCGGMKIALSDDSRGANAVTSRLYWRWLKLAGRPEGLRVLTS
jgi:hypothetical protein